MYVCLYLKHKLLYSAPKLMISPYFILFLFKKQMKHAKHSNVYFSIPSYQSLANLLNIVFPTN